MTQVNALIGVLSGRGLPSGLRDDSPGNPYIVYNDAPKIANMKRIFADTYRDQPVLVMAAKGAGH